LGTLFVNILGCALIGFVSAMLIGPLAQHRELLRLLLIVGVLGGFTTYSSFAMDSIELFDGGRIGHAMLYIILSNTIGLFAAWGCYRLGSAIFITTQS
jgi:CrcB protein